MKPSNSTIPDLERHAAFLKRLAQQTMRGEDAEDLVQDCLLVGLQKGPRDPNRISGWLRTVLRNKAIEGSRSAMRRRQREEKWAPPESQPSVLETVEHRAALRAVTEAVTELSPEFYEVVRLRYFDGRSVKTIASQLNLPTRAVRYRIETALGELRAKLDGKPDRRAAMFLLAGGASQVRGLGLGGFLAMKKTVIIGLFLMMTIGSIWQLSSWFGVDDEISRVEEVAQSDEPPSESLARREAKEAAQVPAGEGPKALPAAIDRQRDIFGRVVDQNGDAVAGAQIESRIYPWAKMSVLSPRSAEHVVTERSTSALDGGFALRHERGDVVVLMVSKPGFAKLRLTGRVAGEQIEVRLLPACHLEVEVVSDEGRPLEGARVSTWAQESAAAGGGQFDQRYARTDEQGRARIDDLSPGARRYVVRHAEHLGSSIGEATIVEGSPNELRVILREAGIISGRVTSTHDGQALAGATVSIMGGSHSVTTDADGHYSRPGCPKSTGIWFSVHVQAQGYAVAQKTVTFGQDSYDFELERSDAVVGVCVDDAGNPLADVQVSFIASGFDSGGQTLDRAACRTEKDGSFRVEGLMRSLPHTAIFQAKGFARRHLDFDPTPDSEAGTIDLESVVLPKGLRISGRVVREDGQVVTTARIVLRGSNADRAERRGVGVGPAQTSYGESEERRADDLGRFCFVDLPSGEFEIEVTLHGSVPTRKTVSLAEDDLDGLEIEVSVPSPLNVKVMEKGAGPLRGIQVLLYDGAKHVMSRKTEESGLASFAGARGEKLRVRIFGGPGSKFRDVDSLPVEAGKELLVVELERRTPIEGRVVGPYGKGLPQVEVSAKLSNSETRKVFTKRDGLFSLDVPAGLKVDLVVGGRQQKRLAAGMFTEVEGAYRGRLNDVVSPASGVLIKVQELKSDLGLTIVVVGQDDQVIPGALVSVSPATGFQPRKTDGEGKVVLKDLLPESQRVQAYPPAGDDGKHYSSEVRQVVPNNQTIEIRLRKAQTVQGLLVLEDEQPAAKFIVTAYYQGEEHYRAQSDQDGRFELTLVAGLEYTVEAQSLDKKIIGRVEGHQGPSLRIEARVAKAEK